MRATQRRVGVSEDGCRLAHDFTTGVTAPVPARVQDSAIAGQVTPMLRPVPVYGSVVLVHRTRANQPEISSSDEVAPLISDDPLGLDRDAAGDMQQPQ
jgi:hypothetical protein